MMMLVNFKLTVIKSGIHVTIKNYRDKTLKKNLELNALFDSHSFCQDSLKLKAFW